MNLTQKIKTYSYIGVPRVNLGAAPSSDPDTAVLTSIQQLLNTAAADFNQQQYQASINAYQSAASLIYAHLDPQWSPDTILKYELEFPRAAALFDPLLSASAQWLNILPVPTPVSPVRPPTAADPSLLASMASWHGIGLAPVSSNPANTAEALADMKLAMIYAGQDNSAASTPLITRAQGLDSVMTTEIAGANGLTVPAATPAPAPAAPAPAAPKPAVPVAAIPVIKPLLAATIPTAAIPTVAPPTVARQVNLTGPHLPFIPAPTVPQRQAGFVTETNGVLSVQTTQWATGGTPDISAIKSIIYAPHATATILPDALSNAMGLWDLAAQLPHYYFYIIPLAEGEAYQALGDYAQAESCFLSAAGYTFVNLAVEGPYIWTKLAELYLAWGDNSFQQGDVPTATQVYSNVLIPGSPTAPTTPLYTLAGLSTAATIAVALIPQLATLASNGTGSVSGDDIAIATVLLQIYGRVTQINSNLDYWGNYAPSIPIWSYTYLQQVAINFAQLAQQCEQETITYNMQLDQSTLTQAQLKSQAAQSTGQVNAAKQALAQAKAQAAAYQAAYTLAQTRATDAAADATDYGNLNSQALFWAQNTQTYGSFNVPLNQVFYGGYGNGPVSVSDLQQLGSDPNDPAMYSNGTTSAPFAQWMAGNYSQDYQIDSMNRTTTEMNQAATQAKAELAAAQAQVTVAQANLTVAQLQATGATQVLQAFTSAVFTPQVWQYMANAIDTIYQQYMTMALRAAKLMQAAYNFENDVSVAFIKDAYTSSGPVGNGSLMGAESLMLDIQSFTDDLVNSSRGKQQLLKTSISLASHNGYLFQTQFVKTGTMSFETSLDDFDSAYPGIYQGRIRSVSLSVQGIVPTAGLSGSLTNGGISWYRLPSDLATPATPTRVRIQDTETLVLSDYNPAQDGVLNSSDGNQMGIFEDAGVASSWVLSIPPTVNDIDYTALTDVVVTFLYEARFDPQLTPTVLAQLATRPGYYTKERTIVLNWVYPDLFFAFVQTGTFTLPLGSGDFPTNQTSPVITAVSLAVTTSASGGANGVTFSLTAPGKAATEAAANSSGVVTSQGPGSLWAPLTGGSALGNWVVSVVQPATNPPPPFDLTKVTNVVLILDYTFTPRS